MIFLHIIWQYFFIILMMATHQVLHSADKTHQRLITYLSEEKINKMKHKDVYQHVTPQKMQVKFTMASKSISEDLILNTIMHNQDVTNAALIDKNKISIVGTLLNKNLFETILTYTKKQKKNLFIQENVLNILPDDIAILKNNQIKESIIITFEATVTPDNLKKIVNKTIINPSIKTQLIDAATSVNNPQKLATFINLYNKTTKEDQELLHKALKENERLKAIDQDIAKSALSENKVFAIGVNMFRGNMPSIASIGSIAIATGIQAVPHQGTRHLLWKTKPLHNYALPALSLYMTYRDLHRAYQGAKEFKKNPTSFIPRTVGQGISTAWSLFNLYSLGSTISDYTKSGYQSIKSWLSSLKNRWKKKSQPTTSSN